VEEKGLEVRSRREIRRGRIRIRRGRREGGGGGGAGLWGRRGK
jgi:hypothetical protein